MTILDGIEYEPIAIKHFILKQPQIVGVWEIRRTFSVRNHYQLFITYLSSSQINSALTKNSSLVYRTYAGYKYWSNPTSEDQKITFKHTWVTVLEHTTFAASAWWKLQRSNTSSEEVMAISLSLSVREMRSIPSAKALWLVKLWCRNKLSPDAQRRHWRTSNCWNTKRDWAASGHWDMKEWNNVCLWSREFMSAGLILLSCHAAQLFRSPLYGVTFCSCSRQNLYFVGVKDFVGQIYFLLPWSRKDSRNSQINMKSRWCPVNDQWISILTHSASWLLHPMIKISREITTSKSLWFLLFLLSF